jgi:hypothetical protein
LALRVHQQPIKLGSGKGKFMVEGLQNLVETGNSCSCFRTWKVWVFPFQGALPVTLGKI